MIWSYFRMATGTLSYATSIFPYATFIILVCYLYNSHMKVAYFGILPIYSLFATFITKFVCRGSFDIPCVGFLPALQMPHFSERGELGVERDFYWYNHIIVTSLV
jgi:hypothetical protein